jgi:hypothetical protein
VFALFVCFQIVRFIPKIQIDVASWFSFLEVGIVRQLLVMVGVVMLLGVTARIRIMVVRMLVALMSVLWFVGRFHSFLFFVKILSAPTKMLS